VSVVGTTGKIVGEKKEIDSVSVMKVGEQVGGKLTAGTCPARLVFPSHLVPLWHGGRVDSVD